MGGTVPEISLLNLALAFVPVVAVLAVLFRWRVGGWSAAYATARMVLQLVLVGYALAFIFEADYSIVVVGVLVAMVLIASWIALRPLGGKRLRLFGKAVGAIALGGGVTLLLITQGVLQIDPWFAPRFMVPLGGMIFANAMNSVSLAGERFYAEVAGGADYLAARNAALRAALIPLLNSLFAVGLVSIPGMMTGQILSGVSPLVAARYQIMVMCMVFGAAGISTTIFLAWLREVERSKGTKVEELKTQKVEGNAE